jgi:hypothetical protein
LSDLENTEVAAKHAAKYDVALENALRTWIEAIVGPIGSDFHDGLKDGVLLCEYDSTSHEFSFRSHDLC